MRKLIVLVLFLTFYKPLSSTLLPVKLTVEYLPNPEAVDSPNPRLSWSLRPITNSDKTIPKNVVQTAYQILVASSKKLLRTEVGDLWNSTKVISDKTINIRYEGKILQPTQTAYWTVKVWDQNDTFSDYAKVKYYFNINAI